MGQLIRVVPEQCALELDYLPASHGYQLLSVLQQKASWEQHTVWVYDKSFSSPRLSAWYGDPGAVYTYSRVRHQPQPWIDELLDLRNRLQEHTGSQFNSVLLNYYRNGSESMGSHSDNEKSLGNEPYIASVSLGATRRFILHPGKDNRQASIKLDLPHGSLLTMYGRSQQDWKHSVPKTRRPVGPRINLTFRQVGK